MKKIIILGLVLLMVVVFATTVFSKAEKSDLIKNPGSWNPDPSGEVVGFAIINNPDPVEEGYNLTVIVSLKKCDENFTYKVYLERYTNGAPIWNVIGELTTNEVGNGTVEINLDTNYLSRLPFGAGKHKLQIAVSKGTTWDFANTAVEINIK
ncbi:hypothetical protein KJ830_08495 [bacterium]|nr:hypothetical protein [bacterium]